MDDNSESDSASRKSSRLTVIFDFDGTLANTLDLVARIYNENAHNYGALPIDMKDLPEYRKLGYKKAMKKAKIKWTILPRLVLFISREMKKHMDEVEPYAGIVDVLRVIQKQGVSIGVLTSNDGALVHEYLEKNNFPAFDFIVSEKTMFGKEKALKRIMKRHGLERNRVLYVGDEPRDITACRKADIKVIGVTWGAGGREGLQAVPPDWLVDTPQELKQTIIKATKLN